MQTDYIYLNIKQKSCLVVLDRLPSGRMKVQYQDGSISSHYLEEFGQMFFIGVDFMDATEKHPELEYEIALLTKESVSED